MTTKLKLLILEDNPTDAELLLHELARAGFECESRRVENEEDFVDALNDKPDLVLADYSLPQYNALQALLRLQEAEVDIPFIVVTGSLGEEAAVECMRHGASDYLLKDRPARLGEAVKRALEQKKLKEDSKMIEAQLQQAQKLETIGQMAGGIAHDFNNLLSVINGCCDLLLQDLFPSDPRRSLVLEIRSAREHASELTHQLLAFSRRQPIQPLLLNLNAVIQDFEKILRRLIPKTVELSTRLAPELDWIRADPSHIQQVLMNLVVNACDAMPNGGRLSVETANAEIGTDEARQLHDLASGPYVQLIVRDDGQGMDKHTLSHLFEPFFTTKGKDKGTGLGLSTVYGIVKQNRGHVEVASKLGQGAVFTLYLPRAESESSLSAGRPPDSKTVLIAVEEELLRHLIVHFLEGRGYDVVQAGSGEEAIEQAGKQNKPVELLIADLAMPDMSGETLMRKLLPTHQTLKTLFVSDQIDGLIDPEWVARGNILRKPFSLDKLDLKIKEIL
ncbi:MAG TPA: hybrid sensor histidine kinase/response regulator [Verrucomicrobia bacterium]|nr:MAG: hypothetical protein A2X46_11630 [Lentisphaerae bacterium GWF2_57_35]HBA85011.1 hybrid sensor histidine kinase/response regulator [Verrucomicrobiota bacterium]